MISVQTAKSLILEHARCLPPVVLPLTEVLGRVLAEPIISPISLPSFDNSAMDGFALHAQDAEFATEVNPIKLPIVMEIAAGATLPPLLKRGEVCRIMTGAPVPPHANAVVRQEDVSEVDGELILSEPVTIGQDIRRAGEDLAAGQLVLLPGTALTAGHISLLAAMGFSTVPVYPAPRVAILTTGNELVLPNNQFDLSLGQIYNSNAYGLIAMIQAIGAQPFYLGCVKDDLESSVHMLQEALQYDLVITSGGVSQGRYDFIGPILAKMGNVHFTSVAQQPGKPFTYAQVNGTPVFGLPGNPVSTLISFEYYVRPALLKMMGHESIERSRVTVSLQTPYAHSPGKQLFLRGTVVKHGDAFDGYVTGKQGSAMLHAMAKANAIIIVPAEMGDVATGDRLTALLLDERIAFDHELERYHDRHAA